MMIQSRLLRLVCLVAIMTLGLGSIVRAQEADLAEARDLYMSAAYEDALTMLNRLKTSNAPIGQDPAVEQYRAFCLIALDRPEDAQRAIEAVVAAEPMYHPSEAEFSPRVRTVFADVRRRMLPAIIQQRYAEAKASFDNKLWAQAADQFREVLDALADPDVAAAAKQPPLVDLRTLAVGFEELSAKIAEPPAPPPVAVAAAPAPPVAPAVYSAANSNVVPPLALNQAMPAYPEKVIIPRNGKVEITIAETGEVETAMMTVPITNMYDAMVLAASRNWRYKPASLNGQPVKYRKVVQIALRSSS
jgi:hypothetical protein